MSNFGGTEDSAPVIAAGAKTTSLFATKSILQALAVTAAYLLLSYALVGFRTDQLVLAGIFNALFFGSRVTRRFILGFSVFIVYWIVFDYMKAFPNYHFNQVHIRDLYLLEKSWFGIREEGMLLSPNEFLAQHATPVLDFISGCFYLCWVPVPLVFAAILFFRNRNLFFQFSLTFFWVNLLGFVVYYLYPAAPPWYVEQYGFGFLPHTPGNTAGLARFDAMTGLGIFKGLYSKSSNVFAAMPSLHASYMMIVVFYGIKAGLKAWNILFAIVMVGIWFTAVYTGHHYLLDVLAGMLCAVVGIASFRWWASSKNGKSVLAKLVRVTER